MLAEHWTWYVLQDERLINRNLFQNASLGGEEETFIQRVVAIMPRHDDLTPQKQYLGLMHALYKHHRDIVDELELDLGDIV